MTEKRKTKEELQEWVNERSALLDISDNLEAKEEKHQREGLDEQWVKCDKCNRYSRKRDHLLRCQRESSILLERLFGSNLDQITRLEIARNDVVVAVTDLRALGACLNARLCDIEAELKKRSE